MTVLDAAEIALESLRGLSLAFAFALAAVACILVAGIFGAHVRVMPELTTIVAVVILDGESWLWS